MSDSATLDAPPMQPRRTRRVNESSLTIEQKAEAKKLSVIHELPYAEIAKRIGAPNERCIRNLAFRDGWAKERDRIARRKEAAVKKATESALARVNARLEASAERAVDVFEDSLEQAAQADAGKRVGKLTEAKLALAIASDVSGRDRQAKADSPSLHLHLSTAWSPRRVDAIDVEASANPATSLNSGDTARVNQVASVEVARPE